MSTKRMSTIHLKAKLGLAAVLISLFTAVTPHRASAAEEAGGPGDALEAAALAAADQSEAKPGVELSPAVVFQVLAAEIAAQ
ncbi:MAG: hypothetical protein EB121_07795, partial [Alphaproteobacteria bacterium]|nr:hypothetical protein [Alphaproteobacteria bacterium]